MGTIQELLQASGCRPELISCFLTTPPPHPTLILCHYTQTILHDDVVSSHGLSSWYQGIVAVKFTPVDLIMCNQICTSRAPVQPLHQSSSTFCEFGSAPQNDP